MVVEPAVLEGKRLAVLAYYFPQYYPIPENNAVFCNGFTDWMCFEGLGDKNKWGQPIKKPTPEPLGYYDPRGKDVREKQGQLAGKYGVDGFVYYHYWHENGATMTEVINKILEDDEPNLPFAFCWDNNHWVAKYAEPFNPNKPVTNDDGTTYRTLFTQPKRHAEFLLPFFKHKNYIKVDGKPMFVVYRWRNQAVMDDYIQRLVEAIKSMGLPGLHIVQCLCGTDPLIPYREDIGPHAYQPFAANYDDSSHVLKRATGWAYSDVISTRSSLKLSPQSLLYSGGLTGWDTSPRYHRNRVNQPTFNPGDWSVARFEAASKARFSKILADPNPNGYTNFYFMFAWNEWGEGATLEPNTVTGEGLGLSLRTAKEAALGQQKKIVGYIHVCQKPGWQRSFKMLSDALKKSGLLHSTLEIRICVVSDNGLVTPDPELFSIGTVIPCGKSENFERPALLNMQAASDHNTIYWYLHTKGLRHFGTPKEKFILDWINLLIYWNVERWKDAVKALETHDVYGCNWTNQYGWPGHFSGNFWWSTGSYLKRVPPIIGPKYCDPEFWLCCKDPKVKNAFCSPLAGMGHYDNPYPRSNYVKLSDLLSDRGHHDNNQGTDKTVTHCYGDTYDRVFAPYEEVAKNILEIGCGCGAALECYKEYFESAKIFGIETKNVLNFGIDDPRIQVYFGDPLSKEIIEKIPGNLDIIIEDGTHKVEHQIQHFRDYAPKVKQGGLYIIEDVGNMNSLLPAIKKLADQFKFHLEMQDLRPKHMRFDDVLFILKRQ